MFYMFLKAFIFIYFVLFEMNVFIFNGLQIIPAFVVFYASMMFGKSCFGCVKNNRPSCCFDTYEKT